MKQSDELTSVGGIRAPTHSTTSRLLLLCDGLIESSWLAGLMVTPLLFNPHASFGGFTPFKHGFLRFCMLIGLAAAATRWVSCRWHPEGSPRPARRRWNFPLALPIVLLVGALVVSTWLSVNRSASFWGAYETSQGLLTWISGVILLLLIATHLRRGNQVERLVTVVLVTSFAVALTAVTQRLGWDPSHPEMAGERVASTVGQQMALADYLMMACPLTLWRLWFLWTKQRPLRPSLRWAGVAFHLVLLAAQLAGFLAAESRGASLAMLVEMFALFIFWAGYRGQRLWVCAGLAASGALVVIGLWLANSDPVHKYASLPGMRRLTSLGSLQEGGEKFRSGLWQRVSEIVLSREPFMFPDGRPDALHKLRFWVGYGPETVECVTPQRFTGFNAIVENRCHNLVWDLWLTQGMLGLAAYFGVVCTVMGSGLYAMGALSTAREGKILWGFVLLLAMGSGLAFSRWVNPGFLGLGLLAGFVAGLILLTSVFLLRGGLPGPRISAPIGLLLLALLAIVLGHLTENAFAFATAPSGTLCWGCLGLILALSQRHHLTSTRGTFITNSVDVGIPESELAPDILALETIEPRSILVTNAFLAALGLVTLLYGFVQGYSEQPLSSGDILRYSLWQNQPGEFRLSLLLMPVVAFWLAATFALSLNAGAPGKGRSFFRTWAGTAILSGAMALAYALFKAHQLCAIGPLPNAASPISSVLLQARGYEHLFLSFTVLSLLLVVLMGASFVGWHQVARPWLLRQLCGLGLVAFVVCCAISPLGLRRLRADLYAQWGAILADQGEREAAVPLYLRALALNPDPTIYRGLLQQSLVESAQREPDAAADRQKIASAIKVLEEGVQLNNLNRLNFVLGQTYLLAAFSEQGASQQDFARKASQALSEARIFEPFLESVWTYSAIARSLQPDESHEAKKLRQQARKIASGSYLTWGDYYSGLIQNTAVAELRNQFASTGLEYYGAGLEDTNLTAAERATVALSKARIFLATSRQAEAIHELIGAEGAARPEDAWQIEAILADFEIQISDFVSAREHLELAKKWVPRDKLAIIKDIENRIPRK